MLEIDGSRGGGQLLRTALALSGLTGEPFEMTEIRGSRPNPGLKHQHLACVSAAAEVCDAEVEGDRLDSESLTYRPGSVSGGELRVDVGTAGSVPLVFDTILPLGYAIEGDLRLRATGGTDVKWAPTMAHHAEVKRRVVSAYGLEYADHVRRYGFYPAGGGDAVLELHPSTPRSADVTARGNLRSVTVHAVASDELEDARVLERAVDAVETDLDSTVPAVDVEDRTGYVETASTGMALCLVAEFDHAVAGFDVLGERGRPVEDLASDALDALRAFEETGAAVDSHTADQVMVPLAVGGGRVTVPAVTAHVETNAEVIRAFGGGIDVDPGDPPTLSASGGLG